MYGYNGSGGFAGYYSGFSSMPLDSDFSYADTCFGATTDFSAAIDSSVYLDSVVWDFGDVTSGTSNNSLLANPSHTFTAPGDTPYK